MKIEIDTEKDTHREFRAAIQLLQALLGQRQRREGARAEPDLLSSLRKVQGGAAEGETRDEVSQAPSGGMFSMFDTPVSSSEETEDSSGNPDDPEMRYYDEELPQMEPY